MGEFRTEVAAQIGGLWRGLAAWQKAVLGAVLIGVPLGLIWLVVSLRPNYVILYGNLSEADRLEIERTLDGAAITYRIDGVDGAIWVPPDKKDRARALLALEGLPHVRTEGYALFDRSRLGATEFEQRLNYQRALEQELQAAIQQLKSVRSARVLLVMPRPTVFTEREKAPTATVLLTLKSSVINDAEIQGITHLVANAVEGLSIENVVVNDSSGRVISKRHNSSAALNDEQAAMRADFEATLQGKIIGQLMTAYGNMVDGTTITSIVAPTCTARFDHDTLETETTTFDPEAVVSKEHLVSESSEGVPVSPVGVPGVTSNILGVGAVPGTGTYSREESTIEYESGVTRQLRRQTPRLATLSTAVFVNSLVLPPAAEARVTAMDQIRNIIHAAVGYDVTAANPVILLPQIEFVSFAPLPPSEIPEITLIWWQNPLVIVIGILSLLALALLALMLKPRLTSEYEEGVESLSSADQSELAELLERQRGALEQEEFARRRLRREALIELADAQPEEIERVMRHWGDVNE